MAEDMMTGMGAPVAEEPMMDEAPAPEAGMVDEPATEEPSVLDATTLAGNFNSLEDTEKEVISGLFEGPALSVMNKLLGEKLVSDFTSQIEMPTAEVPATEAPAEEGLMASPEPAEPQVQMAAGGLTASLHDMVKQGIPKSELSSRFK